MLQFTVWNQDIALKKLSNIAVGYLRCCHIICDRFKLKNKLTFLLVTHRNCFKMISTHHDTTKIRKIVLPVVNVVGVVVVFGVMGVVDIVGVDVAVVVDAVAEIIIKI